MSEHRDLDTGVLSLEAWPSRAPLSPTDPEVLARAVRAHKAGDAFAQAALTVTLMVAIGTVAFVLSAERAAAASLLAAGGMPFHMTAAILAAVAVVGCALLALSSARRRAEARIPRRRDR